MAELVAHNMAPIMFASLVVFLLLGYPAAFSLSAVGLLFFIVGVELAPLSHGQITLYWPLLQSLPERIYGVMNNDVLLAIPFFTFMGLILERSGMAEDLLDTIGQLFGPIRGGLAYAVIFVGALLAATTPVVAASNAPTKITAYARPPRIGPNSWPIVSSRSSAMPLRSRISPIKVKNGTASRVSFDMTPQMRSGNAWNSDGCSSPSLTPSSPKNMPTAASENATG